MLPFHDQTPSSSSRLVVNDPAAETGEGGTQAQSEEIQARLNLRMAEKGRSRMLANLQAARELKIARRAALEAELKNLSTEIEADDKKIADLPGLIEKTQEEASSAITEVNQCDAELTVLSNAQKDYQERIKNIHQTISNASNVIAKYLNI
jgi:chromosome segregation ATPase